MLQDSKTSLTLKNEFKICVQYNIKKFKLMLA